MNNSSEREALRKRMLNQADAIAASPLRQHEVDYAAVLLREAAAVLAALPSHEHIFEDCTCDEPGCRREVCAWCEHVRERPSRETVAPTEEQIVDALSRVKDSDEHWFTLSDRRIIAAELVDLFPGESREAVEAKARAEVVEYIEAHQSSQTHWTGATAAARERFGVQ